MQGDYLVVKIRLTLKVSVKTYSACCAWFIIFILLKKYPPLMA